MTRTNENGQIAVLHTDDNTYYYYLFNNSEVIRVDDSKKLVSNPEWEYDILTYDLATMEIEYLSPDVLDYIISEDFDEFYEEDYPKVYEKIIQYKKSHTEPTDKIEWYDTLTEVLNAGFHLDKNSARDLLGCVNTWIECKHTDDNFNQ